MPAGLPHCHAGLCLRSAKSSGHLCCCCLVLQVTRDEFPGAAGTEVLSSVLESSERGWAASDMGSLLVGRTLRSAVLVRGCWHVIG